MQSQSDCDEAKAICEEYGLPCTDFNYINSRKNCLTYSSSFKEFFNSSIAIHVRTQITLTRFKELCEEYKQLNK